jgi:hypothetical protein
MLWPASQAIDREKYPQYVRRRGRPCLRGRLRLRPWAGSPCGRWQTTRAAGRRRGCRRLRAGLCSLRRRQYRCRRRLRRRRRRHKRAYRFQRYGGEGGDGGDGGGGGSVGGGRNSVNTRNGDDRASGVGRVSDGSGEAEEG